MVGCGVGGAGLPKTKSNLVDTIAIDATNKTLEEDMVRPGTMIGCFEFYLQKRDHASQ